MNILNITDLLPVSASEHYYRRAESPTVIVIHHSATKRDVTPQEIAQYHIGAPDWFPGIAYHFLVYADGKVYQTNDIMTMSYHAGDGTDSPLNTNRFGIGVCLVGDFTHIPPPAVQLAATRELIAYLGLPFIPHKEAYNAATSCPGDTWESWKGLLQGGGMSKLALHFQYTSNWAKATVAKYWGFPRWVKAINPAVPDLFPDTYVLGRAMPMPDNDAWERGLVAQGTAGGAAYFDAMLPYYKQRKGIVTAWEAVNEPTLITTQQATNYRDFLEAWAFRMHAIGLHVCGGSISVGNPKLKLFDGENQVLAIIAPALKRCDYWSYHAYWRKPYNPADNWWAHRYRVIVSECAAMGITLPPCIPSECGADIGGGTNDGWRVQYSGDWNAYFTDLRAFSVEIGKDAYVTAATIFTSAPAQNWASFEIDQAQADAVGQYVRDDAVIIIPPPHEGLPTDETSTNPKILIQKARWWMEEMQRNYEAGNIGRANDIRLSLIQLMYRVENSL